MEGTKSSLDTRGCQYERRTENTAFPADCISTGRRSGLFRAVPQCQLCRRKKGRYSNDPNGQDENRANLMGSKETRNRSRLTK